jgi:hypothetical protein
MGFAERANVFGKTLAFFVERVEGRENPLNPDEFEGFIDEYEYLEKQIESRLIH